MVGSVAGSSSGYRVVLGVLEGVATVHHPVLSPGGEGQEQGSQAGHHSPSSEVLGAGVAAVGALVLGGATKHQGSLPGDAILKLQSLVLAGKS